MTEGEFQKQLKKYHETGEMPVKLAVKLLSECTTDCVYEEETEEAKFRAIKALEQVPILDKIRAEISDFEEEVFNRPNTDYSDYAAVRHCLEIIDKYKAESEDK